MRGLRIAQLALFGASAILVTYLVVLALRPTARLPRPFDWFGTTAYAPSIALVTVVVGLLCAVSYRARRNRTSATVPVVIVVGLLTTAFVLAFTSVWYCYGAANPTFFSPLQWATGLVKGSNDGPPKIIDDHPPALCPANPTVAIYVARLMVLASFAVSLVGVAAAAFRLQADRLRIWLAGSVTAVVGVDEDGVSMVAAIARDSERRGALALLTEAPDGPVAQECRGKGARILQVDFDRADTMGTRAFWRKLNRLYLLSPDPSTNLSRLRTIAELDGAAATRRRLPLIVRIDDPWLAMAWRAEQFGGSDIRWAGDAVGKYEMTARRLLDQITRVSAIRQVLVCGSSQLTLALCADMSRRQLERDYRRRPAAEPDLPRLVLVAEDSKQYLEDHDFQQTASGFTSTQLAIDVEEHPVSEAVVRRLTGGKPELAAAILVDSVKDPTTGTRLSSRFPGMHVYAWDPAASAAADPVPIVGKLRNYRLGFDLPTGHAQDNWERAAMLIHERYRSSATSETEATVPWKRLKSFYKDSNRRQVRNALQIVEQIGGHTWNTWGEAPDDVTPLALAALESEPIEQLKLLGFDEDAIYAMAQAEFEDWSRHLTDNQWSYGPKIVGPDGTLVRNYAHRKHEKLVSWKDTVADDELRDAALRSLASTLIELRELGYRSKPKWQPYRRIGEVTAHRRRRAWSQTTGHDVQARPGDWEVSDGAGSPWSVRDQVFRTSYRPLGGNRWAAKGVVLARRARPGEVITSLEGSVTAGDGAWVVMGDQGEQWTMPDATFRKRYAGKLNPLDQTPVSFQERFEHLKEANDVHRRRGVWHR